MTLARMTSVIFHASAPLPWLPHPQLTTSPYNRRNYPKKNRDEPSKKNSRNPWSAYWRRGTFAKSSEAPVDIEWGRVGGHDQTLSVKFAHVHPNMTMHTQKHTDAQHTEATAHEQAHNFETYNKRIVNRGQAITIILGPYNLHTCIWTQPDTHTHRQQTPTLTHTGRYTFSTQVPLRECSPRSDKCLPMHHAFQCTPIKGWFSLGLKKNLWRNGRTAVEGPWSGHTPSTYLRAGRITRANNNGDHYRTKGHY